MKVECYICGACCIALSISTLSKPAGQKCRFLNNDNKCGNYENRPKVCREYKPDELCVLISTLPLEERVQVFRKVYGE